MNHGTRYAYKQGCHCDDCTQANADYMNEYRHPDKRGAYEATSATLRRLAAAFDRADWMQRAACRGMSPSMFFPERGVPTEKALAVCGRCGVSEECLAHALATNEAEGVWGGASARARRSIRAERAS